MSEKSIGEVAQRAGIAASAIRFYESEGLIPRPARRGGRRIYGEDILDRLALIGAAKNAGFTVPEIKRLVSGFSRRTPPGQRWQTLAKNKLEELDERIAEAQRMKAILRSLVRCACPTLEDCSRALRRSP